jgi:hypothetical protein
LIVQQVNKEWDVNKDTMDAYVAEICKLENEFLALEIHHMICNNNVGADVFLKLGSDRANVPPEVFVRELHHPSIKTPDSSTRSKGIRPRGLDDRGQLAGDVHRLHPGAQTTPRPQPKTLKLHAFYGAAKGMF